MKQFYQNMLLPVKYFVDFCHGLLRAFMHHCSNKIGDAYFRTPRNTIKEFVGLLSVLDQNPSLDWTRLIDKSEIQPDLDEELELDEGDDSDDLASFRL